MTLALNRRRRPGDGLPDAATRRSPGSRRLGRIATPYALILPAAFVYALFTIYPVLRQFDISFFDWHVFPGAANPFTGLANYASVFRTRPSAPRALNTLLYIVITVPIQMAARPVCRP